MKHSNVKGKTYTMIKYVIAGKEYIDSIKKTYEKKLHPGYYGIKNEISFFHEKDRLIVKSEKFIIFHTARLKSSLSKFCESITETYDEKINRWKIEMRNFSNSIKIKKRDQGSEFVRVTFRPGGDYVVTYADGSKSYGEKLKASQFSENGFTAFAVDGCKMIYELSA